MCSRQSHPAGVADSRKRRVVKRIVTGVVAALALPCVYVSAWMAVEVASRQGFITDDTREHLSHTVFAPLVSILRGDVRISKVLEWLRDAGWLW